MSASLIFLKFTFSLRCPLPSDSILSLFLHADSAIMLVKVGKPPIKLVFGMEKGCYPDKLDSKLPNVKPYLHSHLGQYHPVKICR